LTNQTKHSDLLLPYVHFYMAGGVQLKRKRTIGSFSATGALLIC